MLIQNLIFDTILTHAIHTAPFLYVLSLIVKH